MKFFLKLKHWQMFGLMVVIPFCLQLLMLTNMENIGPNFLKIGISILLIYGLLLFTIWLYTLGIHLYSINHIPNLLKIRSFKILMFLIPIYLILFVIFSIIVTSIDIGINHLLIDNMVFILPAHFTISLFLIYCIHFVFASLNMVEKKRDVTGKEIFLDFLLLVIFPIGIWFIQPRINKIFAEKENGNISNSN
jgi:hypothetical protein